MKIILNKNGESLTIEDCTDAVAIQLAGGFSSIATGMSIEPTKRKYRKKPTKIVRVRWTEEDLKEILGAIRDEIPVAQFIRRTTLTQRHNEVSIRIMFDRIKRGEASSRIREMLSVIGGNY